MVSQAERGVERRKRAAESEGRVYQPRPSKKQKFGQIIDFSTSEQTTIVPVPYTIDKYHILTPLTFSLFVSDLKRKGYDVDELQESVLVSSLAAVDRRIEYYKAYFPSEKEYPIVTLTYPGRAGLEKFKLCSPCDKLDFDPIVDLVQTIFSITEAFDYPKLTQLAEALEEGFTLRDLEMVKERLATLNLAFESLPPLSSLQGKFFEEVIEQTYARCVKPQLALLKLTPDKTWSSKVYGELMPHLLDEMFERAKIGKDSLFVDLGSGVGNVVAQASLSTGCASFGIEVCKGPSEIASTFTEQVAARGSIWGMKAGTIKVECGDMLNNKLVPLVIASADMVLVNNKVFSAELNELVKNVIKHMKVGAILVSLCSFKSCREGSKSRQDALSLSLKETVYPYKSGDVSWGSGKGHYYWSEKIY